MKVEVVTLSPGQYDNDWSPYGECGVPAGAGAHRRTGHAWQLMSPPPDPIWFCGQCQRIEQRKLVQVEPEGARHDPADLRVE